VIATAAGPERSKGRLDQWLWFARFTKSRSLAARLCAAGAITVNGAVVKKPNHILRIGDVVVLPQGGWQRSVRVLDLGTRRGPASEARMLYLETAEALRLRDVAPAWLPLLEDEPSDEAAGFTTPPRL
jgi:ribosome-associated heat shock protein Hsp15